MGLALGFSHHVKIRRRGPRKAELWGRFGREKSLFLASVSIVNESFPGFLSPGAAAFKQEWPWPQIPGTCIQDPAEGVTPTLRNAASPWLQGTGSPRGQPSGWWCCWDWAPIPLPSTLSGTRKGAGVSGPACLPLPLLLCLPELVDHEGEAVRQPPSGDAARGGARLEAPL